jgi:predicted ester cyclase
MSQVETNKALIRRLAMAFNEDRLDEIDQILAPDFVLHSNVMVPDGVRGPQGFRDLCVFLRGVMPDAYHPVDSIIGEGDLVLIHLILQGTFENEMRGLPPTGQPVSFGLLNFWRIADGRAVESWWNLDTLDAMQQFGAVPRAPAAGNGPSAEEAYRQRMLRERLSADGEEPISEEQANLALVRRAVREIFNRGNLGMIPEIFAPNAVIYLPNRDVLYGHEGVSSFISRDRNAFEHLYWLSEDLTAAQDIVIHRYVGYGTFTNEWFGIQPNGNQIRRPGMATLRVREGRILEVRVFWDSLAFMQQLGVVPLPQVPPPNLEANKDVVHSVHLSWNVERRDMNIADRLLSPDWKFHPSAQPNIISLYGHEEFKSWAADLVTGLPDFRATIHHTVAEGDLVALRWTIAGTHSGPYMGAAPTGNHVEVTGSSLWRMNEEGQNTDIWFVMDTLNFMRQIGALRSYGSVEGR